MDSSNFQTWLSLLGAGSVGGFLSEWLLKRGESRAARGEVRAAVAEVVGGVWLRADPEAEWVDLRAALRRFQAAAFVARVPRPVAEMFSRLTVVAWQHQVSRLDEGGPVEPGEGPGMLSEAADVFRDAAYLVVENLHQPIRRRPRAQRDTDALTARADAVDDRSWQRSWKRAKARTTLE